MKYKACKINSQHSILPRQSLYCEAPSQSGRCWCLFRGTNQRRLCWRVVPLRLSSIPCPSDNKENEHYLSKVIWSVGRGSEIFWENSNLFYLHLKAYYVCIVTWKLFTGIVLSIRPKKKIVMLPSPDRP